jgi:TetR/AcrR family transcriptional regulator, transcriptional repressor for nem operon
MARPKLYEMDNVLTRAMDVFWAKGFAASSMSDIYQATGLKPGNLYQTFKDKDGLFRRAFEHYAAQFRASLPKGIEGRAAIDEWLDTQARLATGDGARRGCLIVNTIMERDAHSQETQRLAEDRLGEIRGFFAANLKTALQREEVGADLDLVAAADRLTGAVIAIMASARGGLDDAAIHNIAEGAKAALGR